MVRHCLTTLGLMAIASCSSPSVKTSADTPRSKLRTSPPRVEEGDWKINGLRLRYRMVGSGKTIVLLHGGPGGNFLTWKSLEGLADTYRLVMYDQRGSGESERLPIDSAKPPNPDLLSAERHVEDLEAIRAHLGLDKMIVMGHSWGGTLAGLYAAKHPDRIDKLVLYDGLPYSLAARQAGHQEIMRRVPEFVARNLKEKERALEEQLPRLSQAELDAQFMEMVVPLFSAMSCDAKAKVETPEGHGGFWANVFAYQYLKGFDEQAFSKAFAKVTAPALIIWGRCEPYPLSRALEVRRMLPRGRMVVLERSGHQGLSDQHDLFMQMLRAFLEEKPLPLSEQLTERH